MELAEIVMNPVRQRIFQYFLLHETGTVKKIRKALPDIPSASLYRHIKVLADCCKIFFHRQCRSAKGYAAVHELHAAADRRGIFEVPFGNQSGYGQVHETGKLGKQQTAENHAHFRPDERVGAGYAKEMKVSERIDCPQILLRTDCQALLVNV